MIERVWIGVRDGGPELVFLHEGLGSITQWRETPAAIAALTGRPAFVYARQGYGTSDPVAVPRPLTYMHDEAARLPELLAAEGVRDPILIGHSDGASIAIIAAGVVKPRALVLIAPHVFVEDVSVRSIEQARDAYAELRPKLARHHADVDGAFWGWNRAWLDPAFRAWNIEAYLPRIEAPVLIVQGEVDEYGTIAQVEAIARRVASETMLVAGAGHSPHRTHPAEVHARIAQFLTTALAG
ncbi:MAG: alpha/beta hydrolase [Kofleriaceae bacterium]